jgi:hypothetical protein
VVRKKDFEKAIHPLDVVVRALLHGKTWRILRYVHARQVFLIKKDIRSVPVIVYGNGIAEVGLALNFRILNLY